MMKKGIQVLYWDIEELSELLEGGLAKGPLGTKLIQKMDFPFLECSSYGRCERAAIRHAGKNGYNVVFVRDTFWSLGVGATYSCEFYSYDAENHFEKRRKELREKLWKQTDERIREEFREKYGVEDIFDSKEE